MYVEMKIDGIALDSGNKTPVVLLSDLTEERTLPVWIGVLEASAILYAIEGVEPPRPFTHDLLKMVVEELGGKVLRLDIDALDDGVFHGKLHLEVPDHGVRLVDCRPSDGLAIAVRCSAPIFAEESVLREAGQAHIVTTEAGEMDEESWKEYLENLDPEDFGKYKM